jgi:hypothetical protein
MHVEWVWGTVVPFKRGHRGPSGIIAIRVRRIIVCRWEARWGLGEVPCSGLRFVLGTFSREAQGAIEGLREKPSDIRSS